MRRGLGWVVLLAGFIVSGCVEGRSPLRMGQKLDAGTPDSALPDAATTKRKKLPMPTGIPEPPPRPEGEPSNPDELRALSSAAEGGAPVEKPGAPPIKRLDAYRLRVGEVFVDRLNRFVEVPARLNMKEGILEYYGVGPNGKTHESVLVTLAEPSHVHLGLLLIGSEPREWHKQVDPYTPLSVKREGTRLDLRIKFTDPKTGKLREEPGEIWLYNRKAKKAPEPLSWHFQGSRFWNNRYVADLDRSMIGLIGDETTVVTVGSDAGNPYHGDSLGYEMNTAVLPEVGTRVGLILKVHDDQSARDAIRPPPPRKSAGMEGQRVIDGLAPPDPTDPAPPAPGSPPTAPPPGAGNPATPPPPGAGDPAPPIPPRPGAANPPPAPPPPGNR